MFYTFTELPGKGEQCSQALWGTFSTDLGVSPVYQVKTPERTQAGNLNEEACLTRDWEKAFAIWFHITAKKKKKVGLKETLETTRGSGTQLHLTSQGSRQRWGRFSLRTRDFRSTERLAPTVHNGQILDCNILKLKCNISALIVSIKSHIQTATLLISAGRMNCVMEYHGSFGSRGRGKLDKSNIFLTCDLDACKKEVLSHQPGLDDYSPQKDLTDTFGLNLPVTGILLSYILSLN